MDKIFQNILYIGPEKEYGGMGTVLEIYSDHIKHFKFFPTYPSPSTENKGLSFKIHRLFFFVNSLYKVIKALIVDKEIKILHIHSAHKGSFYRKSIVCLIAKLFRKKVVFHLHSGNFKTFYKESTLLRGYIRYILSSCHAFICLSPEWQEYFISELKLKNTVVIGNPIHFAENSSFKKNLNGTIHLLFLGKVCDDKGIFDLIEFLRTNKYFLDNKIQLVIGGNGEVERLQQLIRNEGLKNIHFIGWVRDDEKQKAINDCDVYILPSYYEGLPISILEAMACYKPIIATNVGGIPTIVKNNHNGWLIEPGSFTDFENVFNEMFRDKNLLEIYGTNSFEGAKKYSPEVVFGELESLYKSLLKV